MTDQAIPEALGDIMARIAPEETPLYSLLRQIPVKATGVVGSPVQHFARAGAVDRDELLAKMQAELCSKDPEALVASDDLDKACVTELQRAKFLRAIAQKRDLESALLSSFAPSPEIEGVTPARMWSLGYEPTIYQRGELNEASFKAFLGEMFAAGANTSDCIVSPVEAKVIASFVALISTRNGNDVYVSDFGEVEIHKTVFAQPGKLLFIENDRLKLGVHLPMQCRMTGKLSFIVESKVTPVRRPGCVVGVFEVTR